MINEAFKQLGADVSVGLMILVVGTMAVMIGDMVKVMKIATAKKGSKLLQQHHNIMSNMIFIIGVENAML